MNTCNLLLTLIWLINLTTVAVEMIFSLLCEPSEAATNKKGRMTWVLHFCCYQRLSQLLTTVIRNVWQWKFAMLHTPFACFCCSWVACQGVWSIYPLVGKVDVCRPQSILAIPCTMWFIESTLMVCTLNHLMFFDELVSDTVSNVLLNKNYLSTQQFLDIVHLFYSISVRWTWANWSSRIVTSCRTLTVFFSLSWLFLAEDFGVLW